jgi:hypothetical protein
MPQAEDCQHVAKLVAGGTVEVTVVDADGAPVADTRVEHTPPSGGPGSQQTAASGLTAFAKLVPGTHKFRIATRSSGLDRGMGFFPGGGQQRAAGAAWESVEVADGAVAKLRIVKAPAAKPVALRGVVRENGAPLEDARVAFVTGTGAGEASGNAEDMMASAFAGMAGGAGRNARTGADGGYALKNVAAGAHRLRVTHKGRAMPTTVAVTLVDGDNTFDVELETTVLRGTVRDAQGKPVADATVGVRVAAAEDAAGTADQVQDLIQGAMPGLDLGAGMGRSTVKTAADGSYELRGVQAGVRVRVRASAKGYAAASSEPVEPARGGTLAGVDVQLTSAGSIEVVAQGTGAFTTARATLEAGAAANGAGQVVPVFQILRNGKCRLDGLRAGRWKVELVVPGEGTAKQTRLVDVVAGETARVEFG